MKTKSLKKSRTTTKIIIYIVCIFLAILSVIPFWLMFTNATRSTIEIQNGISLLPSRYLLNNLSILLNKGFNPVTGFINSLIIACGATGLAVYFSSLTAYALMVYRFRARQGLFTFIMCTMMIPAQVSSIGFYQFMYKIHWNNNFMPLILPTIAAPAMVFFMRQYLLAALPLEMVDAARIDGCHEFGIFNRVVLPIMVPAIATQAIFSFIASWNNLFTPMILLTSKDKYTMPIMVNLLRGDIYRTEYGSIYLGLSLTTIPLFLIYFLLSRYIIAGITLGGVKE
ncbi:MAG: carbohydrate ABC transporter permease [Acetanaerobacterium sp.]